MCLTTWLFKVKIAQKWTKFFFRTAFNLSDKSFSKWANLIFNLHSTHWSCMVIMSIIWKKTKFWSPVSLLRVLASVLNVYCSKLGRTGQNPLYQWNLPNTKFMENFTDETQANSWDWRPQTVSAWCFTQDKGEIGRGEERNLAEDKAWGRTFWKTVPHRCRNFKVVTQTV